MNQRKNIENSIFNFAKSRTVFCRNFAIWAVQRNANLVDLGESFPTSIWLQKSASIQPRTSLSKFGGWFNSIFNRVLTYVSTSSHFLSRADSRGVAKWFWVSTDLHDLGRARSEVAVGQKACNFIRNIRCGPSSRLRLPPESRPSSPLPARPIRSASRRCQRWIGSEFEVGMLRNPEKDGPVLSKDAHALPFSSAKSRTFARSCCRFCNTLNERLCWV